MKKKLLYSLLIFVTAFHFSCNDEEERFEAVVELNAVFGIGAHSAVVKNTVVADAFTPVTRGIVWSDQSMPEVTSNLGMMTDGEVIGEKYTRIDGLQPGKSYYVRVYATTAEETLYSEQFTFRTTTGVTDIEGYHYPTIIMGELEWMAENLRTTTYSYQVPIPSGAYHWYDNNPEWADHYGALYNWTADFDGICPAGWSVPTAAQWEAMINIFGGEANDVEMLKSTRTHPDPHPRWEQPNTFASNLTGFSALPGGRRAPNNVFQELGTIGYWWSSTETAADQASYVSMNHSLPMAGLGPTLKAAHYSIRCVRSFDGSLSAPTVQTSAIDSVWLTSAIASGLVLSDGGAEITSMGIIYDLAPGKTVENAMNLLALEGSTGPFSITMANLTERTRWYVRAWAENAQGIAYGEDIAFTTRGSLTDENGNQYTSVIIGNQEWMASNLRTTKYNDGTPIISGLTNQQWQNTTDGAFTIYPHEGLEGINNPEEMLQAYGALYNWYAVQTEKLCPQGWRIPNNEEWWEEGIIAEIGGPANGYVLRSCRQVDAMQGSPCDTNVHPRWDAYGNIYGTDVYGFNGLPAGSVSTGQTFNHIGKRAIWWNSTDFGHDQVPLVGFNHDVLAIMAFNGFKNTGASVRCIRDFDTKNQENP